MKELRHILDGIVSDLGITQELKLIKIRSDWKNITGELISMHAEPWSLKDGILTLKVDSPHWMQEIRLHENLIIEKINDPAIKEIKLKLGRINRHDYVKGKKSRKSSLNRDEMRFIDMVTSEIKDEGLRHSIRRAMERSFIQNKKGKV